MSTAGRTKPLVACDLITVISAWMNKEENMIIRAKPDGTDSSDQSSSEFPDELAQRISWLHATAENNQLAGAFEAEGYPDDHSASAPAPR